MTTFARIENGAVIDQNVVGLNGWSVPPDETWLPVVVELEEYDRTTHHEVSRGNRVEPDRVVRYRVIEPIPVTAAMVKEECQRRVIAATGAMDLNSCLIKQLNANMRAAELIRIKQDRDWTTEEAAEAGALESLAAAIKRLRAKSNEIEAMDPMPIDFRDDQYWG